MNSKIFGCACFLFVALMAGCRGQTSDQPPIVAIRNMYSQPRYNAQSRSAFFSDERTMRPPVYGTIAREMETNPVTATGRALNGGWELEIPSHVVRQVGGPERLVQRGKDRYAIYCAPCHADSGDGKGMVVRRAQRDPQAGALKPPTFHDDRLRHAPDGQIFGTITNGIRNMPAYRHSIPIKDRWAIVAYIRALQFSQLSSRTAMNTPEPQE